MDFLSGKTLGAQGLLKKETLRARREAEKNGESVRLLLDDEPYRHSIRFQTALADTLSWMMPNEILSLKWTEAERQEALLNFSRETLPKTWKQFPKELESLTRDYNKEMEPGDWLFIEHFRYFHFFTEQSGAEKNVAFWVKYEMTVALLRMAEFDLNSESLTVNPSLRVIDNRQGWIESLEAEPILLFVHPQSRDLRQRVLLKEEAQILDEIESDVFRGEAQLSKLPLFRKLKEEGVLCGL